MPPGAVDRLARDDDRDEGVNREVPETAGGLRQRGRRATRDEHRRERLKSPRRRSGGP